MNPYDTVGTTRLSTSVHDRLCRLAIGYQDAEAERGIVARRTGLASPRLVADAVALTRATRDRDEVRQGSSVRGAIDVALVAAQLAAIRGVPLPDEPSVAPPRGLPPAYTDVVLDAVMLALSGRIFLDETVETTPEALLRQIWEDHFLLLPAAAAGRCCPRVTGGGRGPARPGPVGRRRGRRTRPRTWSRWPT
jgi:MoxR-like ATPase